MAVEVSDAISEDALEAAAQLTCDLVLEQPCATLDAHVERAVRRTFCACVVDIEDAIEGGVSGMHKALLETVERRARQLLSRNRETQASCGAG